MDNTNSKFSNTIPPFIFKNLSFYSSKFWFSLKIPTLFIIFDCRSACHVLQGASVIVHKNCLLSGFSFNALHFPPRVWKRFPASVFRVFSPYSCGNLPNLIQLCQEIRNILRTTSLHFSIVSNCEKVLAFSRVYAIVWLTRIEKVEKCPQNINMSNALIYSQQESIFFSYKNQYM